MRRRNTNSAGAWVATVAVHVGATAWLGWRGFVVAVAAFLVGGVGAIVNLGRAGAVEGGQR